MVAKTKAIMLIKATFLSVVSIDFLLPYSLELPAPDIPNPKPHLGDISNTDITNNNPDTTNTIIKKVYNILLNINFKTLANWYIFLLFFQLEKFTLLIKMLWLLLEVSHASGKESPYIEQKVAPNGSWAVRQKESATETKTILLSAGERCNGEVLVLIQDTPALARWGLVRG